MGPLAELFFGAATGGNGGSLELIEAMGGSVSERVILISGNPGAVDLALIGKLAIHTFLVKPFHLDEIAQAIKGTQG